MLGRSSGSGSRAGSGMRRSVVASTMKSSNVSVARLMSVTCKAWRCGSLARSSMSCVLASCEERANGDGTGVSSARSSSSGCGRGPMGCAVAFVQDKGQ